MSNVPDWVRTFPGAITISDKDNVIVYMNEKAEKTFAANGGAALVGKDLLACHNDRSKAIIAKLLENNERNVYTIEKSGVKKLVYQTPWHDETGAVAGLIELSLEIPFDMPHFVRV